MKRSGIAFVLATTVVLAGLTFGVAQAQSVACQAGTVPTSVWAGYGWQTQCLAHQGYGGTSTGFPGSYSTTTTATVGPNSSTTTTVIRDCGTVCQTDQQIRLMNAQAQAQLRLSVGRSLACGLAQRISRNGYYSCPSY